MYGEILKFGSYIVDALVEYEHPIFIYIPPNGELRGGAWVVIDPQINPDKMEMYADVESRGGILEPPGIVEVKYRQTQQVEAMHRHDEKLKKLDADVAKAEGAEKKQLEQEIKARERQLLPLYTSIAVTFADLHDKTGRMKAKGVIREGVEWKNSRRYFYWRVKRRVLQDHFVRKLREADKRFNHSGATDFVKKWATESKVAWEDDKAMVSWLESQDVSSKARDCKVACLKANLQAMFFELPEADQQAALAEAARGQVPGSPGGDKGGCSLM
uniref:CoA carboxyltransferase C-terminal domain-containing protein n=1 Tax=Alexandrium monilatum TaxID=311494 RepID=A0A7S4RU28_9DINO